MSKEEKRHDIEDRLIDFAVRILKLAESLPKTKVGSHIANQIIRKHPANHTHSKQKKHDR